ncbi:hypothetical protein JQ620_32940 [Bradyrhizobium sp. AUGA SZCCT0274]|uniref:hypothetical protein n=1 Tax=Bradyrhizobium sp. AUGA SZCCT0274 TaxID=2807670 RepID=UPI001BA75818|nr:hypothetical protein [Bradyrhizobium sp. AUGA SZCCT0274]MBR1244899.1 hypothetical protein [Bradyrhizobium sp. AUGA SZCCT0274]
MARNLNQPPRSQRRLAAASAVKGNLTGEALIAALQASPLREIDIEPMRTPMPVPRPDRPLPRRRAEQTEAAIGIGK